ncbi:MAG: ribosomal RNA small subunit methyltransferase A [Deltaproteobacteria bacterium]|nr:ribosomal RNA small subunit methyltransferase A [Deltaproteobacteria bacterium]
MTANHLGFSHPIELVRQAKLACKKSLGQHHLVAPGVISKITELIPTQSSIIEIGPGAGVLSWPLATTAKDFYLIEKDSIAYDFLKNLFKDFPHVKLIHEDFLEFDLSIFPTQAYYIVSNLPYNVGTAILLKLLKQFPHAHLMILMFQKEVADRLLAKPKTKNYGSLSVFVQTLAKVNKISDVEPGAFLPPPDVRSTIVKIEPYPTQKHSPKLITRLENLLKKAFQQRRKMLKGTLKGFFPPNQLDSLLKKFGNPKARPEELTPNQWQELATS